ncbi:MAG: CinA family nicotinamide mononucleotide deamidase-related protein [Actinomycetota bacterium]
MMLGEFVGVGDEILLGDTVNSNAAVVGRFLASLGVRVRFQSACGDRLEDIASAVRQGIARADVVVVSGGLGPTQDDLTREGVAAAIGCELRRDPDIVTWLRELFASWGRDLPEANLQQADVLEGAEVIWPKLGTAPGIFLEHQDTLIFLLPGVPSELEEMLERGVKPAISSRYRGRIETRTVRIFGVPESAVADRLRDVWDSLPPEIEMSFLANSEFIRVRFTGDTTHPDTASGVEAAVSEVRNRFADSLLSADSLQAEIGTILGSRGQTLSVAESLTAGGLADRLTSVPGASSWFLGGIIAYSDKLKRDLLCVDARLLDEHGAVSGGCARAMAEGARRRTGSDLAISLTGVAGPDEQDGHPVGEVFVALATPEDVVDRRLELAGDRSTIRSRSVSAALRLAVKHLR